MEKLFINKRYVGNTNLTQYICVNGVIKRYIPSPFVHKSIKENGIWYMFDDLSDDLKEKLRDMTITESELVDFANSNITIEGVYPQNGDARIHINDDTLLLPIVGNFLPSDGINAYTIEIKDGVSHLEPILVCWNMHWSELFTGNTKYGNNVFCLKDDLSIPLRERFESDFIRLGDASSLLDEPGKKHVLNKLT